MAGTQQQQQKSTQTPPRHARYVYSIKKAAYIIRKGVSKVNLPPLPNQPPPPGRPVKNRLWRVAATTISSTITQRNSIKFDRGGGGRGWLRVSTRRRQLNGSPLTRTQFFFF